MSTVPSGKKRNIDLHIFPKERTPLHSRFNKKEWKFPKRDIHSFFIFHYFHKFIFRYRPKNISQFHRKKSTPFEMLHRSPIGHAAAEREFLFAFFC